MPETPSRSVPEPDLSRPAGVGPEQQFRKRTRLLIVACAGLVGGGAGWLLIQRFGDSFTLERPESAVPAGGGAAPIPLNLEFDEAQSQAQRRNIILSLGLLGIVFGGLLTLAACVPARSLALAASGACAGILLGGTSGALGGVAGVSLADVLYPIREISTVHRMIAAQFLAMGILAVGIGVGVALPSRSGRQVLETVGVAVLASILAGALYQVIVALLLPGENTEFISPRGGIACAIWTVLTGLLVGLGCGWQLVRSGARAVPAREATAN